MPEFKPASYTPEQKITLNRQAIQDLHRAAEQFPDVDSYDITVTPEGIKATFTIDFTRAAPLSPDMPKPTEAEVLAQLADLRTKPPTKQTETKEDNQNATHNQDTVRPTTEAAE
jgi:hypothetical protein